MLVKWWRNRQIRNAFSQYLDPKRVEELAKNPDKLIRTCHTAQMSCLLLQVRDTSPEGIQACNMHVEQIYFENRGTGLGAMGSIQLIAFGVPLTQEKEEAERNSAATCKKLLEVLNDDIRIVSFSGEFPCGNIGGEKRFSYTIAPPSFDKAFAALLTTKFGEITELPSHLLRPRPNPTEHPVHA